MKISQFAHQLAFTDSRFLYLEITTHESVSLVSLCQEKALENYANCFWILEAGLTNKPLGCVNRKLEAFQFAGTLTFHFCSTTVWFTSFK